MTPRAQRHARLLSHRLTAPAATVGEAAEHMLAVQSQEFWAGRWALAVRTRSAPTLSDVDALFDSGVLVRAWTMRGTLHIVPARHLSWMLQVTGERQLRAAAPRYRELGLDAEVLRLVERAVRAALRGGDALTRAELFTVLERVGIDPSAQRGLHAVQNLALRGILCQGPVVARDEGRSREQRFVLTEEHISDSVAPADPQTELFIRYIAGHGPAGTADFAWWSGLTLTAARAAADAAGERVERIDEDLYRSPRVPVKRRGAASVLALGPFEEYYISYVDRTLACPPDHLAAVGPGRNGMVRAIILSDGVVIGTWRHSTAVGRHTDAPVPELFGSAPADDARVAAALERYAAFIQA